MYVWTFKSLPEVLKYLRVLMEFLKTTMNEVLEGPLGILVKPQDVLKIPRESQRAYLSIVDMIFWRSPREVL